MPESASDQVRMKPPDGPAAIGVMLAIDLALAAGLPPFNPRDEQSGRRLRRGRRGPYMKRATLEARLEPYVVEARAGIPDRLLAQRAGVSTEQVRQWRRRRSIHGRRGRPAPGFGAMFLARALIGEPVCPLPHLVTSPVGGRWRVPVYLLREPLDYALFAQVVAALSMTFSPTQISRAVGIAERDVVAAIALHAARGAE